MPKNSLSSYNPFLHWSFLLPLIFSITVFFLYYVPHITLRLLNDPKAVDFHSTYLGLTNCCYLPTAIYIQNFMGIWTSSKLEFAYFLYILYVILSVVFVSLYTKSLKISGLHFSWPATVVLFSSSLLNLLFLARFSTMIRWSISTYIFLIILLILHYKIASLKANKPSKISKNGIFVLFQFIKSPSLLILSLIAISTHYFSIVYFLSLITFCFIDSVSDKFRQKHLAVLVFFGVTLIFNLSIMYLYVLIHFTSYGLGYNIEVFSEFFLVLAFLTHNFFYIINKKFRQSILKVLPISDLLFKSTAVFLILPLPFLFTRLYTPYIIVWPVIFGLFLTRRRQYMPTANLNPF